VSNHFASRSIPELPAAPRTAPRSTRLLCGPQRRGRVLNASGSISEASFSQAPHNGSSRQDSTLWMLAPRQSGKMIGNPNQIGQGHGRVSQVTGSADGKALIYAIPSPDGQSLPIAEGQRYSKRMADREFLKVFNGRRLALLAIPGKWNWISLRVFRFRR